MSDLVSKYVVMDPKRIKNEFDIDNSPVGLIVSKQGNNKYCTVDLIPPNTGLSIQVSDSLLHELLEEGCIKQKEGEVGFDKIEQLQPTSTTEQINN